MRNNLDPATIGILLDVHRAAAPLNCEPLLIGAFARDLWLRATYELSVGRATEDYDLALMVRSWDHYAQIREALIKTGRYQSDPNATQRLVNGQLSLDLVPFGGLETPPGSVAWPPDGATKMSTLGLKEAFAAAERLNLDDEISILVTTLPALVALKLVAWKDRQKNKDAYDVILIAKHYADAGNMSRLLGDEIKLVERYADNQLAGAALLGVDIRSIVAPRTEESIKPILFSAAQYGDKGRFIGPASNALREFDDSDQRAVEIIEAILFGMS